jgi:hypothetical protein
MTWQAPVSGGRTLEHSSERCRYSTGTVCEMVSGTGGGGLPACGGPRLRTTVIVRFAPLLVRLTTVLMRLKVAGGGGLFRYCPAGTLCWSPVRYAPSGVRKLGCLVSKAWEHAHSSVATSDRLNFGRSCHWDRLGSSSAMSRIADVGGLDQSSGSFPYRRTHTLIWTPPGLPG